MEYRRLASFSQTRLKTVEFQPYQQDHSFTMNEHVVKIGGASLMSMVALVNLSTEKSRTWTFLSAWRVARCRKVEKQFHSPSCVLHKQFGPILDYLICPCFVSSDDQFNISMPLTLLLRAGLEEARLCQENLQSSDTLSDLSFQIENFFKGRCP